MYTMYMALHINNPEVERTVRKLAGVTGQSMTDAIGTAAAERLQRLKSPDLPESMPSFDEIKTMIRSFNLKPIHETLTDDEILGYGPDGIPE